ncbi:MAG: hypothetical protein AAF798_09005 [Bacteroidota bacterium]
MPILEKFTLLLLLAILAQACTPAPKVNKDELAQQLCSCQKELADMAAPLLKAHLKQQVPPEDLIDRLDELTDDTIDCMNDAVEAAGGELDSEEDKIVQDLMRNRYCPESSKVVNQMIELSEE